MCPWALGLMMLETSVKNWADLFLIRGGGAAVLHLLSSSTWLHLNSTDKVPGQGERPRPSLSVLVAPLCDHTSPAGVGSGSVCESGRERTGLFVKPTDFKSKWCQSDGWRLPKRK